MKQSNRIWLPAYCDPNSFLPAVQETVVLFSRRPYLFQDFVGRALSFLKSEEVTKMGFQYDPKRALPCKWKCSDESLFGVDLVLYAYTGHYPFDKGRIGGVYNETALGAAVHHSSVNIDFGGSHVGYVPEKNGGSYGRIARPLNDRQTSTDCGYLMAALAPFKEVYDDACKNIFLFRPDGRQVIASIPNEFLQPGWSTNRIKLLVDIERFTTGPVPYNVGNPYTHKVAGRSLFYVSPEFLGGIDPRLPDQSFMTTEPQPIGNELTADYFSIYDSEAELVGGVPVKRFLPYAKYILSSKVAPYPLKAAVTSSNIEHNRLTDSVRVEEFRTASFASFTGVFIDIYDEKLDCYVNLFQPVGLSIKPAGKAREIEISAAEIHHIFDNLEPAQPQMSLEGVLGYERADHVLDSFSYRAEGCH
ncbi:MAG: hypothetical protein JXA30_10985 [Deltaproteobacteria bacterium]|nr:hypothetical protein [Deltaproteobacteria bacterium]